MCHTIGPYRNGIEWNGSTEMEVINYFHLILNMSKEKESLIFIQTISTCILNKIKNIEKDQQNSVS